MVKQKEAVEKSTAKEVAFMEKWREEAEGPEPVDEGLLAFRQRRSDELAAEKAAIGKNGVLGVLRGEGPARDFTHERLS
jgi:hypothetical protein